MDTSPRSGHPGSARRHSKVTIKRKIEQEEEEDKFKIKDEMLLAEQKMLEDEKEKKNKAYREYDPLPWWKRILLDPDYRASMIFEASKCYEEELQLLHNHPEKLSSSQGMTHNAVMSQYVALRAGESFSHRHPHLIIKHSKLETLRRVALNNMPPARDTAHHNVQKQAIEDYLMHRRRASLTRSRRAKRIEGKRIIQGKEPIPPLPITEVYNVAPPAENEAAFTDNLEMASTPPLSPVAEMRLMLDRSKRLKEEEEERLRQREERDRGGIPARMLSPTRSPQEEALYQMRRKTSLNNPPASEHEKLAALNAAKSCVDGMDNLYGLSYFWDLPLPPAGFIRSSPDPRHAMWPDDFREQARRHALQKRKADVQRKIQQVNEQNKKKRLYIELGLRMNPLQFFTAEEDEDDEQNDLEEAENIRKKLQEDGVLEPIYSGPLNINIFVEEPVKKKKNGKKSKGKHSEDSHSSRPATGRKDHSPSASPHVASPAVVESVASGGATTRRGVSRGVTPAGSPGLSTAVGGFQAHGSASADSTTSTKEKVEVKRGPKMVLAGTYRQSLLLVHYKNYARALHQEENRRLRGPMAGVGGQFDDPVEIEKRFDYHQKHSERLRNVPRFEFPVLRVQSSSPPLKVQTSLRSVDISQIPPASCWEGLCPSPSPDPTHPANNAWRHLQCSSLLARQAVQDTFNCLDHDPDGCLDKRSYVSFVLDLLHLFFPTYHQHIHIAIAEEEWVFRGTTENVRFETFFQKFFSFPFIFMRDISSVHEQEYVEFWSIVRVCLFETEDSMPTLVPFECKDHDFFVQGTVTTSRTPEEAKHLEASIQWRREGMEFSRSIRLVHKPGAPRVLPVAPPPPAPTPPSPMRDGEMQEESDSSNEACGEREEEDKEKRVSGDSSATVEMKEGAKEGQGPVVHMVDPSARSSEDNREPSVALPVPRSRRFSLLAPFTIMKPSHVQQLYKAHFKHPEDYDLVLMARHVAAEDPLIPHLPPSHREAVIRARAHELLNVCRMDVRESPVSHQRAQEERQRQLDRIGAELTFTIAGASQNAKMKEIREQVVREMADFDDTSTNALKVGGGESRSAQVLRLEKERRAVIERLERERNKSMLLHTSHRYHDRQRRIHAHYAKVVTTVESMASAWELHYDDVFELVQKPQDVEDGLIEYLDDVEEDMFSRNVSLRERFLVHEAFKRERQQHMLHQARRRKSQEESAFALANPTDVLKKQLEKPENSQINEILAPYRKRGSGEEGEGQYFVGSTDYQNILSKDPDGANYIPYPPRKLSMAPLMDPVVMEHLYLTAMKSNPTSLNAITSVSANRKFESFVTGAYPLHPTEGTGPAQANSSGAGPTSPGMPPANTFSAPSMTMTSGNSPSAQGAALHHQGSAGTISRFGGVGPLGYSTTSPEESHSMLVNPMYTSISSFSNYRRLDDVFVPPLTMLERDRHETYSGNAVYTEAPRRVMNRNDFGGLNVDGPAAQRHLFQVREKRLMDQFMDGGGEKLHFHTTAGMGSGTYNGTWNSGDFKPSPAEDFDLEPVVPGPVGNPLEVDKDGVAQNAGGELGGAGPYPPVPSYTRDPPPPIRTEPLEDSIVGNIPILPTADRRKIGGIPETVVMTLRRMRKEKPPSTPDYHHHKDERGGGDQANDGDLMDEDTTPVDEGLDSGARLRRRAPPRTYDLDPRRQRYPGDPIPYSKEVISAYAPSTRENLYGLVVCPQGGGKTSEALVMGRTMLGVAGADDTLLGADHTCRFDESYRAVRGNDDEQRLNRAVLAEVQREEQEAAIAAARGGGQYYTGGLPELLTTWGSMVNALGPQKSGQGRQPQSSKQHNLVNHRALASTPHYTEGFYLELNYLLGIREEDPVISAVPTAATAGGGVITDAGAPSASSFYTSTPQHRLPFKSRMKPSSTLTSTPSGSAFPPYELTNSSFGADTDGAPPMKLRNTMTGPGTLTATSSVSSFNSPAVPGGGPASDGVSWHHSEPYMVRGGGGVNGVAPVLGATPTSKASENMSYLHAPTAPTLGMPSGRLLRDRQGLGATDAQGLEHNHIVRTAKERASKSVQPPKIGMDEDLKNRLTARHRWNEEYRKKYNPLGCKQRVASSVPQPPKVPTNLWARLSNSSGWGTEDNISGQRHTSAQPRTTRSRQSSKFSSPSTSRKPSSGMLGEDTPEWALETMQKR